MCEHVTEASTYITVHYINGIHVSSRCMDNVQPRIRPFWNEADPCLAYTKCGTSMYGKTWRDTDATVGSLRNRSHPSLARLPCGTTTYSEMWWDADAMWVPIWIGHIHPSQDFPVVPPRVAKHGCTKSKFWQKVNVLGVSQINHRLISNLKEPKEFSLRPLGLVYP
jgi:hypothetical protein